MTMNDMLAEESKREGERVEPEKASRFQSRKDVFFILYCEITYKFCKFEIIKMRLNFLFNHSSSASLKMFFVTKLRFCSFKRFIQRFFFLCFEFSSSALLFHSNDFSIALHEGRKIINFFLFLLASFAYAQFSV